MAKDGAEEVTGAARDPDSGNGKTRKVEGEAAVTGPSRPLIRTYGAWSLAKTLERGPQSA